MHKSVFLRAARDWTEDSLSIMVTPSLFAKSNLHYVQEIGHYYCLTTYFTERENLTSFLVAYTVSGQGYLRYKGKSYIVRPGQAFFIHCMDYQFYRTDTEQLWEIVWVHFEGGASRAYYEQFQLADEPVITLNPFSSIPSTLNELIQLQKQQDSRTEWLSSQAIILLLTDLVLHILGRSLPRFLPEYILQVQIFLKDQLHLKITLDHLSTRFSISKFHLAREFKVFTGLTPNDYLLNLRINKAKELLSYTTMPILEIARQVGIENVSHFINQFKKQENTTPLSFRKAWQRPL